ncbi:type-1 angiotensin II receptor-associated protein-like [Aplysia californica]|uniref:Type-1 angiotensin II receptor-associated protein-like n=1 Tax=Aplysia californica TaxID=6500 RepID=A0ABM0K5C6_APLCA|nr:type-1 angiotensin II receptor-associated protein-like [Aplysia californica]XP_005109127.2 type-1 angiotensin II receptor-associated protein-like [Aplysia californica]
MALSPPSVMLKIVWMTHFILSSWALMSGFLAVSTYWYTHVAVLAFGFWAMVAEESVDAVLMFLATLCVSVVNDIMCLAIYEPRGHDRFESQDIGNVSTSQKNEYRFALGMAITNLIVKPLTIFLVYRVYQSRSSGSEFNAGIPGISGIGRSGGGYDNIDDPYPNVHGKPSAPPTYQEPPASAYQSPPPPQASVASQGQSEA